MVGRPVVLVHPGSKEFINQNLRFCSYTYMYKDKEKRWVQVIQTYKRGYEGRHFFYFFFQTKNVSFSLKFHIDRRKVV